MADEKIATLLIELKLENQQLYQQLSAMRNQVEQQAKSTEQSWLKAMSGVKATIVGTIGAVVGSAVVKMGYDVATAAARVETLGVVMGAVGKNVGYTKIEMAGFASSLQKAGISIEGSREAVTKMARAQVDMSQSFKLARVAQDAAVIGNMNSTEAFTNMIYGLETGNARILRTIGLIVNFKKAEEELAQTLGKSSDSLTEKEKIQARTNELLRVGTKIEGAYEASMQTAGKQMLSLKRHMDDLKAVAGEALLPILSELALGMTDFAKAAKDTFADPEVKQGVKDLAIAVGELLDMVLKSATALIGAKDTIADIAGFAGWLAKGAPKGPALTDEEKRTEYEKKLKFKYSGQAGAKEKVAQGMSSYDIDQAMILANNLSGGYKPPGHEVATPLEPEKPAGLTDKEKDKIKKEMQKLQDELLQLTQNRYVAEQQMAEREYQRVVDEYGKNSAVATTAAKVRDAKLTKMAKDRTDEEFQINKNAQIELQKAQASTLGQMQKADQDALLWEYNFKVDAATKEGKSTTAIWAEYEAKKANLSRKQRDERLNSIAEVMGKEIDIYEKAATAQADLLQKQADAYAKWLQKHGTFIQGLEAGYLELQKNQLSAFEMGEQTFNSITENMANSFQSIFVDAFEGHLKSAEDYFKAFAKSILSDFMSLVTKMAAQQIMLNVVGNIGSAGAGGAASGLGGSLAGGAAGGAGGAGALGFLASDVTIAGGGTAAAVTAPVAAVAAVAIAATYITAKTIWDVGGRKIVSDLVGRELPKFTDVFKGGKALWGGDTKGATELQTWEKFGGDQLQKAFGFGQGMERGEFGRVSFGGQLKDEFTEYKMVWDDLLDVAEEYRIELGFTNATAEEMGGMLLSTFEKAGATVGQIAVYMRDMLIPTIMKGTTSFVEFKKVQAQAFELNWLEELQGEIVKYIQETGNLTEGQYNAAQGWFKDIALALDGDAEASARLHDIFGEAVDNTKIFKDQLEAAKEEYEGLQEQASKLNDIISTGLSLQDRMNALLFQQEGGDKAQLMQQVYDIKKQYEAYKEQFKDRPDLLAEVNQWYQMEMAAVAKDYGSIQQQATEKWIQDQVADFDPAKYFTQAEVNEITGGGAYQYSNEDWWRMAQSRGKTQQVSMPGEGQTFEDWVASQMPTTFNFMDSVQTEAETLQASIDKAAEQITNLETVLANATAALGTRIEEALAKGGLIASDHIGNALLTAGFSMNDAGQMVDASGNAINWVTRR